MLGSVQISSCRPYANFGIISAPASSQHTLARVTVSPFHGAQLPLKQLRLVYNAARRRKSSPVCFFGGKGKSENNSESSPWKALEKLMGGPKELTVQDVLRERKQAQEFDGGGGGSDGGAGNRPGGSGGNDFGNSEDGEGDILEFLDEVVQVMLATLSLLSLYIYIIQGQELTLLGRDYIKYLSGGEKSARLTQAMHVWARIKRLLTRKEPEIEREDWLEHEIINTPTWWHSPSRVKRLLAKAIAASEMTDAPNAAIANASTWQHKPSQVKRMHSEPTEDSDMSDVKDDSDMPDVKDDSDVTVVDTQTQSHDFWQSLSEIDRHLEKLGDSEIDFSEAIIEEEPPTDSDESDDS